MKEKSLIRRIAELPDQDSKDDWIDLWMRIDAAKNRWDQIYSTWKEVALQWLDEHGDIELPDGRRIYPGWNRRTVCKDTAATLEAIISATGGDIEAVAECLSANCFKPGACRGPLRDEWPRHFEQREIRDIKTGKVKRGIKIADDKYTTR